VNEIAEVVVIQGARAQADHHCFSAVSIDVGRRMTEPFNGLRVGGQGKTLR
jgi:hypothetical protein